MFPGACPSSRASGPATSPSRTNTFNQDESCIGLGYHQEGLRFDPLKGQNDTPSAGKEKKNLHPAHSI
jgi:hypothetical protein